MESAGGIKAWYTVYLYVSPSLLTLTVAMCLVSEVPGTVYPHTTLIRFNAEEKWNRWNIFSPEYFPLRGITASPWKYIRLNLNFYFFPFMAFPNVHSNVSIHFSL